MNVQIPVKWLQELLALCGPEDHELRERVMVSITAMDEQTARAVAMPEPDKQVKELMVLIGKYGSAVEANSTGNPSNYTLASDESAAYEAIKAKLRALLATVTGKSGSNDSPLLAGVSAPAAQAAPAAQSVANADGRFTKNPVTIDAIKWTGSNLREVIAFTDGPPDTRSIHAGMAWEAYVDLVARDGLKIYTLEGKMLANIGDWIIRGIKGEHYPCKDEIFRLTYEPVVARES